MATSSKKEVDQKIDMAATAYRDCWETLEQIKLKTNSIDYHRLLDFQPRLAQAIYDLDRSYDELCRQEKILISKKAEIEPQQFVSQMSDLAGLKHAIDRTLLIGKGIGDAFAWIFYARSQEMLSKHATKPRLNHTPPGLGGLGELTFVKSTPRFKYYLPLYHGITTFLRSGDFSLIDLRNFKVAALVELKTSRIDTKTLSFSLNTIGPQSLDDLADGFPLSSKKNGAEETPSKPVEMNVRGFKQRLDRQVKTMHSVLKESVPDKRQDCHGAYHIEELRDLLQGIVAGPCTYKQAGPGLLLIAINMPKASLSERMCSLGPQVDIPSALADIGKEALKIVCPGSRHNALIVSELNISLPAGATPMFWWPVDLSFLKKIFFQDVWIGTAFNPAHIAEKLIAKGFAVDGNGRPEKWSIYKPMGQNKATLMGWEYFVSAIQSHLMREDAVVEVIEKATAEAVAHPHTKVNMIISHHMG